MKTILSAIAATVLSVSLAQAAELNCKEMDPGISGVLHQTVSELNSKLDSGALDKDNAYMAFTDLYPKRLDQYIQAHQVTRQAMNRFADQLHDGHHCFPDLEAFLERLRG